MNLKYIKVSLFEISYKKKKFTKIHIYWDAPVYEKECSMQLNKHLSSLE